MNIKGLLEEMVTRDASDLHLKAGSPPGMRVHGELTALEDCPPLTAVQCRALLEQLLSDEQKEMFDAKGDLDFSFGIDGLARFRVNTFRQRGTWAAVLRKIPIEAPILESMGFPETIAELCQKPRGLVLVTGSSGAGKSTTLAAMTDHINRNRTGHILTLENPIEFIHRDKSCFVSQREVGSDSTSFAAGLQAAMREDPDYIVVGELSDLETIQLTLTAAESGHLVFATLYTRSAIQAVDRIIDVFPQRSQQQVRMQLSTTLRGVIAQTLVPRVSGGRVCAQEIMVGTEAVRSCIVTGKTNQLVNPIVSGGQFGMQSLEADLAKLAGKGAITVESAVTKANSITALKHELQKLGLSLPPCEEQSALEPVTTTSDTAELSSPSSPSSSSSSSPSGMAKANLGSGVDPFEQFRAGRGSG